MTNEDRKWLLKFVTRSTTFIFHVDKNNVISFIHGYQIGTRDMCNFTGLLGDYLFKKYKIKQSGTGWPGQIDKLAKQYYYEDWVRAFKTVSLELLLIENDGELEDELKEIVRSSIKNHIAKVEHGHPWFEPNWVDKWIELYNPKNSAFKKLWTSKEWKVLKGIDEEILKRNVFKNRSPLYLPSEEMLQHRLKFDELQKKQSE